VCYPDGSEHGWEVITRPKRVVAVLANTTDRALVLIAGHRPLIGRWNVTLPAGLVEPGKTPEEACRDELHEETGYVGGTVRYLATPPSSPGLTDEATMLHHMPDVAPHPGGQRLEPTEQIEVLRVPLHEFDTFMLAVLAREETFALDAKIAFALRIAQLKNLL
jgi:ADP-ribose pyrophosphatase